MCFEGIRRFDEVIERAIRICSNSYKNQNHQYANTLKISWATVIYKFKTNGKVQLHRTIYKYLTQNMLKSTKVRNKMCIIVKINKY